MLRSVATPLEIQLNTSSQMHTRHVVTEPLCKAHFASKQSLHRHRAHGLAKCRLNQTRLKLFVMTLMTDGAAPVKHNGTVRGKALHGKQRPCTNVHDRTTSGSIYFFNDIWIFCISHHGEAGEVTWAPCRSNCLFVCLIPPVPIARATGWVTISVLQHQEGQTLS